MYSSSLTDITSISECMTIENKYITDYWQTDNDRTCTLHCTTCHLNSNLTTFEPLFESLCQVRGWNCKAPWFLEGTYGSPGAYGSPHKKKRRKKELSWRLQIFSVTSCHFTIRCDDDYAYVGLYPSFALVNRVVRVDCYFYIICWIWFYRLLRLRSIMRSYLHSTAIFRDRYVHKLITLS